MAPRTVNPITAAASRVAAAQAKVDVADRAVARLAVARTRAAEAHAALDAARRELTELVAPAVAPVAPVESTDDLAG